MSIVEWWNRFALTVLIKFRSIEYLTSTVSIPCSIYDICFYRVSFLIKLAVFLASGRAHQEQDNSDAGQPGRTHDADWRIRRHDYPDVIVRSDIGSHSAGKRRPRRFAG